MGMTRGLIALAAALTVATLIGVALRYRAGRFRARSRPAAAQPARTEAGDWTRAAVLTAIGSRADAFAGALLALSSSSGEGIAATLTASGVETVVQPMNSVDDLSGFEARLVFT